MACKEAFKAIDKSYQVVYDNFELDTSNSK